MPVNELHLRLERNKLYIRPPLASPADTEFSVEIEASPGELQLLRCMRECLCSANPQHPSSDGWFEFFGRRLAARLHADATRYLPSDGTSPLRVFLQTTLPNDLDGQTLREAPWELLRFSAGLGTEAVLGTSPRLTVTRLLSVDASQARPGPVFQRKLRVLFIDASTPETADLGGDKVRSLIDDQIEGEVVRWTGQDLRTCWDQVRYPRKQSTSHTQSEFDVIHILGHGKQVNGQVEVVVDDEGTMSAVQIAEALAGRCRIAVLQSCSTAGAAPELLSRGPEAVVAMLYDIDRDHSTAFITRLYSGLANGDAIDVAVQQGRNHLDPAGRKSCVGAPVLYARTTQPVAFLGSSLDGPAVTAAGSPSQTPPPPGRDDVDALSRTARPAPPRTRRTSGPAAPDDAPIARPRGGQATSLLGVRANREEV